MSELTEGSVSLSAEDLWSEHFEVAKSRQRAVEGQEEALWRAGGRATKANPNKEDGSWWNENGPKMVQNWIDFRSGQNGWKIWETPEGKPAIELALNIKLGGVSIKMALDRLMVTPDGELVVVDIKTGRSTPSSDFQLGIYACGIETVFGIRPQYGAYWAAREGSTTQLVDLSKWTIDRIGGIMAMFEKARREGIFLPNFDHCKMCNFTEKCKYNKGEE